MNYPLSMVITLVLYTFTNPFAQAQLLGGAVPALCNCSAGTYCAVVLGCAPCEAGTSSEAGSTSCTQCPAVGQLRRNTASLTNIGRIRIRKVAVNVQHVQMAQLRPQVPLRVTLAPLELLRQPGPGPVLRVRTDRCLLRAQRNVNNAKWAPLPMLLERHALRHRRSKCQNDGKSRFVRPVIKLVLLEDTGDV
jgi:hypothetical protein